MKEVYSLEKKVGQRFKLYREKAGLTQEELAEKVGLNSNYISRIERGDSFPRLEAFVGLLNALEVSADAIDSEYFVGYEFKKPLLEVQQAIIYYLLDCV